MSYQVKDGWLNPVKQIISPNCDARPTSSVISLLVIHSISLPPCEFGGPWISDFFTNKLNTTKHDYFKQIEDLKVSSHIIIRRTGEIIQYVPFDKRAWHAGKSKFQNESDCNDFSIGIELEGCDEKHFEKQQMALLVDISITLMETYTTISPERIVGHCHIAPGRKTDPGELFDWAYYHSQLKTRYNK